MDVKQLLSKHGIKLKDYSLGQHSTICAALLSVEAFCDRIAHALAGRREEVASALLAKPSSSTRRELHWGRRGSLVLCRMGAKRGVWFDHEAGAGGDGTSARGASRTQPRLFEIPPRLRPKAGLSGRPPRRPRHDGPGRPPPHGLRRPRCDGFVLARGCVGFEAFGADQRSLGPFPTQDRKSTRLNSSH